MLKSNLSNAFNYTHHPLTLVKLKNTVASGYILNSDKFWVYAFEFSQNFS